MDHTARCASLADFKAAVDAGKLGRVLPALTLHGPGNECHCGASCKDDCPQRCFEEAAQHALGELAQCVTAGELKLARGTLGAMQLLALLREALRWEAHGAAAAFAAFAGTANAPRLPLSWWPDLLCTALKAAVRQQLPAVQGIAARCNAAAARVGRPALPPSPTRREASAIFAALSESSKKREAGMFPALAKVGSTLAVPTRSWGWWDAHGI